ncbi:ferredoxin [Rhodococcus sp. P1Y]|uniref:ferredoxin n=1 Tax=Rhodococcus sp. P1Y TaxID=1302308 RepID=UPI000EAC467B|nr:ferredoxin [Rhodococcus sp. P1Y]AYJ50379.1 ferredoxin [Rhodococcus sp. P1Y]
MRVRVDSDRCQGHTLCAMAAPAVFELNDMDGHASVATDPVPPGLESPVRSAQQSCPEQAIEVEDHDDDR